MCKVTFNPGDVNDKLSIAYAVEREYQFRLDGDGNAEVSKPDGTAYYVVDFICDCPDRKVRGGSHGGHCKHEIWVSQIRPCEYCGGTMALGTFKTAFGQIVKRFECPDCCNARDFDLVKQERRERKARQVTQDPKEVQRICQAAIYESYFRDTDRYVWDALKLHPELAPAMVERLEIFRMPGAKMTRLADEVARRYRLTTPVEQAAD